MTNPKVRIFRQFRFRLAAGSLIGLCVLWFVAGCKTEKYRELTPNDGLTCEFSQDISVSMGPGLSGSMKANGNHFECTDKLGNRRAIELKSVGVVDGKVEIKTEDFGTVYKGNEFGSLDKYEMTESQIAKLKELLGSER